MEPARRSRIVRTIWAACLFAASLNHARILVQHGLAWDYGGAGTRSAIYWTSLTVIDPFVAVLLLVRPRAGIAATLLLITTNVAHNLAITAAASRDGELLMRVASDPQVLSQIAFLLFVVATAHVAWRGGNRVRSRKEAPASRAAASASGDPADR